MRTLAELQSKADRLEQAERLAEQLEQRVQELTTALSEEADVKRTLEQLRAEASAKDDEVQHLRGLLQQQETKLHAMDEQLRDSVATVRQLTASEAQAKGVNAQLRAELDARAAELAAASQARDSGERGEARELLEKLRAAELDVSAKGRDLAWLTTSLDTKQADLAQAQERITALSGELQREKDASRDHERTIADLTRREAELDEQVWYAWGTHPPVWRRCRTGLWEIGGLVAPPTQARRFPMVCALAEGWWSLEPG